MESKDGLVVAAFDFDGTITRRDSFWAFCKYVDRPLKAYLKLLTILPRILPAMLGWRPKRPAIEMVFRKYLAGKSVNSLYVLGESFASSVLPGIVLPRALERVRWHQEQGHRCFLVTASLGYWTEAWAEAHGLKLIAALPLEENGIFQGKFAEHTNGELKVKRLEDALKGQQIIRRYAYGNSEGDLPMLAWADEGYFKPFD